MNSTLTDREKENLLKFFEVYSTRNNPLLDDPWTPSFGHYPASLLFTDENDPAGQNRDGTQTAFDIQEPVTASRESFRESMRALSRMREFQWFLAALAAFLVVIVVFGK